MIALMVLTNIHLPQTLHVEHLKMRSTSEFLGPSFPQNCPTIELLSDC